MVKVFLTSATKVNNEHGRLELSFLQDSTESDRFGIHEVTEDPDAADLILFIEREEAAGPRLEKVTEHPLYRQYKEKAFVVNPRYKGVPVVKGVYASIPEKWYDRSRFRSGHYLEVREDDILKQQGSIPSDAALYSFRGKLSTHPVRKRFQSISSDRGLITDTTELNFTPKMQMEADPSEFRRYREAYVESVRNSKFVLCPRGVGPSSLRLFECMLMGRAPVIISDAWVPPPGPQWDRFSVRVPERGVREIPELLRSFEARAEQMGRLARQVWEAWFSREASFRTVVNSCMSIKTKERAISDYIAYARMKAYQVVG